AVALVAAGATVALVSTGKHHPASASTTDTTGGFTAAAAPARSSAPADPSTPTGTPVATRGSLTVVHGARMVNGVGVGYPHSLTGAVSAAVEYYSQLGSNLEPQRGTVLGGLIAVASWTDAPQTFAQAAV